VKWGVYVKVQRKWIERPAVIFLTRESADAYRDRHVRKGWKAKDIKVREVDR